MNQTITLITKTAESAGVAPPGVHPVQKEDAQALARLLFTAYDDDTFTSQDQALHKIYSVLDGVYGEFYPGASPMVSDPNGRAVAALLCLRQHRDSQEPAAVIYELVTAASRRREGLAEQLVRFSLTALYRAGIHRVSVSIPESNAAALALYLTLGFSRWHNPEDTDDLY